MHPGQVQEPKRAGAWALCIASVVLLFLGFFSNAWNVADARWFQGHQRDSEAIVLGRLAKSRQDGILSAGGLLGAGVPDLRYKWFTPRQILDQYSTYIDDGTVEQYSAYMSQSGGQGMLLSVLDRLVPASSRTKLALFHALTALLTACALTAILAWIHREFGGWAAVAVLGSMLASQWLTVFGRNLYWSLWALYVPMVGALYVLARRPADARRFWPLCGALAALVLVKCFVTGFEVMTSVLVMMMVPPVYYAVRDRWETRRLLRWGLAAASGSAIAVALSVALLCVQIGAVKGGLQEGVDHIAYSFAKQTHGDAEEFPEVHRNALRADTASVVAEYVNGAYFDADTERFRLHPVASRFTFKLRYLHLIVAFALASGFLLLRARRRGPAEERRSDAALVAATWFAILAPLSWYVIFKSHSYKHFHTNYILWQMPFTLFGFALIGLSAERLAAPLVRSLRRRAVAADPRDA